MEAIQTRGTCPPNCQCCDADSAGANDICYVEGASEDKTRSPEMHDVSNIVWKRIKPPTYAMERPVPAVTARKVDVVRAQLLDKARYRSPFITSTPKK